jgi:UDP-N-acetylglucosamine 1-carboxyvinyltransferase
VADGVTEVHGAHHVDRGYARFAEQLVGLGADVRRESAPDDLFTA